MLLGSVDANLVVRLWQMQSNTAPDAAIATAKRIAERHKKRKLAHATDS